MSVEISQFQDKVVHDRLNNCELQSESSISKAPVSMLAIAQLMLASVQLIENSLLASLNIDQFRHAVTRNVILFIWGITLAWMIVIFILLYGIMSNRCGLILPHLFFCVILVIFKIFVLVVLIASDSFTLSIFMCAFTVLILLLSIRAEWKCYVQMRTASKLFLMPYKR